MGVGKIVIAILFGTTVVANALADSVATTPQQGNGVQCGDKRETKNIKIKNKGGSDRHSTKEAAFKAAKLNCTRVWTLSGPFRDAFDKAKLVCQGCPKGFNAGGCQGDPTPVRYNRVSFEPEKSDSACKQDQYGRWECDLTCSIDADYELECGGCAVDHCQTLQTLELKN